MTAVSAAGGSQNGAPSPTTRRPGPIFVVGAPGSGTAAVYQALAAHSSLWGAGGGEFLAPLLASLPAVYASGTRRGRLDWLAAELVSYEEFAGYLGRSVVDFVARRAGDRRWVDHSAAYGRLLEPLSLLVPSASVVFVVRDAREAAAAMMREVPGLGQRAACRTWQRYADAWRRAGSTGLRVLQVRHDRLVAEPSAQLRRILDFLEEEYEQQSATALSGALSQVPLGSWSHWDAPARLACADEAGEGLLALGFASDTAWVRDAG